MRSTRKGKEKGTKNVEMGRGKVRKKGERERERVGVGDPSPRVGDSQSLHFSLGPLSSHNLQKKKLVFEKPASSKQISFCLFLSSAFPANMKLLSALAVALCAVSAVGECGRWRGCARRGLCFLSPFDSPQVTTNAESSRARLSPFRSLSLSPSLALPRERARTRETERAKRDSCAGVSEWMRVCVSCASPC